MTGWLRFIPLPPVLFLSVGMLTTAYIQADKQIRSPSEALVEQARPQPSAETPTTYSLQFSLPATDAKPERLETASERPLFAESRRVPQPVEQTIVIEVPDEAAIVQAPIVVEPAPERPIKAQPPERPDLVLKGVMLTGNEKTALIFSLTSGREEWVSIGDVISDWNVAQITHQEIRLQLRGFEHVVELDR